MPDSRPSSIASGRFRPAPDAPVCRIEWRGSRALAAALVLLGVLAALGVLSSEAPLAIAGPSALLTCGIGVRLARRELSRPAAWLVVPSGQQPPTFDGIPMRDLRLQWRGLLACLAWRDPEGRLRRLHGWPDVLDAAARRELRLACDARRDGGAADSMAP